MLALGLHGGHKRVDEDNRSGFAAHDSAAVLVKDGEILAAIEEERLDRIKHSNCFPVRAVKYCLDQHCLTLDDIDLIAINHEENGADALAKWRFLEQPEIDLPPNGRSFYASLFAREFGADVSSRLRFCNHHIAHAWSAYAPSGFRNALILVLDGDGDNRSGMALLADGPKMTKLKEFSLGQSLGRLYTDLIRLLGYHRFDEYKVMGLAPYGDASVYNGIFEKCYKLLPNGDYSLSDAIVWMAHFEAAGLIRSARRKGAPFTQAHKDLAASIQVMLEKIVLHVLRHLKAVTRQERLCLAGGVAHNCTMNGKVLYSGLFKDVFVQPAAHDAGGALGAAYLALHQANALRQPRKLEHLYFGTHVGDDAAIGETLRSWGELLCYEKSDHITQDTAKLLADGHVVGWVQARSEFGPRALGNRSILADPRPAENKSIINQMVKKRESYRPFAPSVLEERVRDFFDVPESQSAYPFMIFVVRVREDKHDLLQAITHVDGTGRLHSINRQTNPLYYDLISEFGKLTGVPVLLNTSFNNNAEPIVDTAEDAIACYLTTGLHYLVIGDYLISRKPVAASDSACRNLAISLPPSRRLVQRQAQTERGRFDVTFEIESTVSRFFTRPLIRVSEEMFHVLQRATGEHTFSELLAQLGIDDETRAQVLCQEALELWSQRAIVLRPLTAKAAGSQ